MAGLAQCDGVEAVGVADVGRHLAGVDHLLDLALEGARGVELQRQAGRGGEGLADGVAMALLGFAAPVPHDDLVGGGLGVAGLDGQRRHARQPHSIRKLRRSSRPDLKAIAPSRARSFRKALSCHGHFLHFAAAFAAFVVAGTAPGLMRILRPLLRRHRPRPRPEHHRSSRDRRLVSSETAPCCAMRGREPRSTGWPGTSTISLRVAPM